MAIKGKLKMLNFLYKVLADEREKLGSYSYSQEKKPTFHLREETRPFERSTPHEQGMTNQQFKDFFDEVNNHGFNFHSILFAKKGKVVGETSFAPYDSHIWSVTHSLCKTITGLAVGMAIDEGYFKLNDNVYELLKGKTRFYTSSGMKRLTVKHLLTMTSGVNFRESSIIETPQWSDAFLAADFSFAPGERFEYNSLNTYMLAVIIYRKTGKTLMEYLEPRLFQPLGIDNVAWEKGPEGIEKAGWGMYITIEGLAKLGQLVLQVGEWDVEGQRVRLVSRAWMSDMFRPHVRTSHIEAYGYQVWVDPAGRYYCFSGLFGQTVYVNPGYDFVAVFTSGNNSVFNSAALVHALTTHFCSPAKPLSAEEDMSDAAFKEMMRSSIYYKQPLLSPMIIRTEVPVPKKTLKQKFLHNVKNVFKKKEQTPPPEPIITKEYPLPDAVEEILNQKYLFKENSVGLLPVLLQMMDNNFAQGVKSIAFYQEDGKLYLHWEDEVEILNIPVGLYIPEKATIELGGEHFVISTYAYLTRDEDNHFVLKITMCFLETSSVRILKCFFIDNQRELKLELDETPSVSYISNTLLEQVSANDLPSFLARDNGYVKFLIDRLTLPVIVGERVEDFEK